VRSRDTAAPQPQAAAEPAVTRRDAGTEVWGSDAWREQALAWFDARLAEHGIQRRGVAEQPHLRPWATALRAPTNRGVFWMKAAAPGTAFEMRLYPVLSRLVPEHVLEPLAVDEARAWIILPDGGTTLGHCTLGDRAQGDAAGDRFAETFARALSAYARLQRALAPTADELVRLGVSDMRAAVMPQRFDEAALEVASRLAQGGSSEDRATYERVLAQRDTFGEWCRELAQSPILPSLDHNDLHPWNIFWNADGQRTRFYDWGDSVVAHPFASLLVALGFVRFQLKVPADDARVERVRDAYLAEFAGLASHAELVRSAELACHVAKIARVLTWTRALAAMGSGDGGELARAPLRWFGMLLDPSPVGIGG
jgi:hypothetical protein